jgi:two-component system NtrC family sensor kinase
MAEIKIQKFPVLILGAGRGGSALLEMFLDEAVVNVIAIADLNQDAPGIKLAKSNGIPTYSDYIEAIRMSQNFPGCVVYNLTHDDSISKKAVSLFSKIKVTEGAEAKLLWQMVTNMKRMKEKLEAANNQVLQSEKMASIGQLAAGVAHEINNPIGYVFSNLGTLEKYIQETFNILDVYEQAEGFISNPEIRVKIKAAKDKADINFIKEDLSSLMAESKDGITRVKNIVQNLKDFSHVDAHDDWQFSDLHKGIDTTLNIVNNEIKYKADVIKEYGNLPEVECLVAQLNQVFMNLFVNAAHAIDQHGAITVRTGRQGDEVWVDITDTGKGIAPEHLKKIFDPFFTTKPIGKGTGLGLSVSYGIIQKHHGRFEVQSLIGKGTTFRIWLPISQSNTKNG